MLPSIFGENLFDDFFSDPFEMMMPHEPQSAIWQARKEPDEDRCPRDRQQLSRSTWICPGFKKDEVNLELKDGYLTVYAQPRALDKDEKDNEGRYIRQERWSGSCSRELLCRPRDVKPEDVHARSGARRAAVVSSEAGAEAASVQHLNSDRVTQKQRARRVIRGAPVCYAFPGLQSGLVGAIMVLNKRSLMQRYRRFPWKGILKRNLC